MLLPGKLIDARYVTQGNRIASADGLHAGHTVAVIAENWANTAH